MVKITKQMEKRTIESWAIEKGKPGLVFYSEKKDRHLTSIAATLGRKIKTERVLLLTNIHRKEDQPACNHLLKVTLL
jgi:hypothetical protein